MELSDTLLHTLLVLTIVFVCLNSYYSQPPRYQPMDYVYQNYNPPPNYNSGYRYPTPTEPMPNMQAPSHETMKKWYLQGMGRSEEHTSELQSHSDLVCRLLLEKKKNY